MADVKIKLATENMKHAEIAQEKALTEKLLIKN